MVLIVFEPCYHRFGLISFPCWNFGQRDIVEPEHASYVFLGPETVRLFAAFGGFVSKTFLRDEFAVNSSPFARDSFCKVLSKTCL